MAAVNGGLSFWKRLCPLLALSGHAWVHCTCLLLIQSGHLAVNRLASFLSVLVFQLQRYNLHAAFIGIAINLKAEFGAHFEHGRVLGQYLPVHCL